MKNLIYSSASSWDNKPDLAQADGTTNLIWRRLKGRQSPSPRRCSVWWWPKRPRLPNKYPKIKTNLTYSRLFLGKTAIFEAAPNRTFTEWPVSKFWDILTVDILCGDGQVRRRLVLCAETSCTETFESETSCAKSFCAVPFCVHRCFQRKCFQQRCFVHRHFIHRRFVPRQCAFRDRGPLWPKRIVGREELEVG